MTSGPRARSSGGDSTDRPAAPPVPAAEGLDWAERVPIGGRAVTRCTRRGPGSAGGVGELLEIVGGPAGDAGHGEDGATGVAGMPVPHVSAARARSLLRGPKSCAGEVPTSSHAGRRCSLRRGSTRGAGAQTAGHPRYTPWPNPGGCRRTQAPR